VRAAESRGIAGDVLKHYSATSTLTGPEFAMRYRLARA
jgi:hypothetical protein